MTARTAAELLHVRRIANGYRVRANSVSKEALQSEVAGRVLTAAIYRQLRGHRAPGGAGGRTGPRAVTREARLSVLVAILAVVVLLVLYGGMA